MANYKIRDDASDALNKALAYEADAEFKIAVLYFRLHADLCKVLISRSSGDAKQIWADMSFGSNNRASTIEDDWEV